MSTPRFYRFGAGYCHDTLILLVLLAPIAAESADTNIESSVRVSQLYTDNVSLNSSISSKADLVTELEPGIHIDSRGKSSFLSFDYRYQNRKYWYNENNSNNTHTLNSEARTELLRRRLFLDAGADLVRQNTDFGSAVTFDDVSIVGNKRDVLTTTAGAAWSSKMGPALDLVLSQRTDTANTLGYEVGDAVRDTSQVAVSGRRYPHWLPWSLSYSHVNTRYKIGNDSVYETVSATMGYVVSSRLTLSTTGSKQHFELADNSQNNLPTNYSSWMVAARYLPTVRTDASLSYGKQIHGESKSAHLNHRSRHAILSMNYEEVITSSSFAEKNSISGDFFVLKNDQLVKINDNSANPPLSDVKGVLRNTTISTVNIGNYYFIQRKGVASLQVQRRRTLIKGSATAASYQYIGLPSSQQQRLTRINADVEWNVTRRIDEKNEVGGRLLGQRFYFYSLAGHDDLYLASVNYKRILGSQSDVSASYQYYIRDGEATGQSARENRAIVTFTKVF